MSESRSEIGVLIREWRTRRRMSQLDLASEADVSQRHLSFIESGRAQPSRDMILKLSEPLDIPLRQRNRLLMAAGFAPSFGERPLGHPSLAPAFAAVESVLKGHEPNPALAVDRHMNMVAGNGMVAPFLKGIAEPSLLASPVNMMRLSLHPKGLAPRIVNIAEWRAHLLARLRRLIEATGDPVLEELEAEMLTYPSGVTRTRTVHDEGTAIVHPLRIKMNDLVLSFISTISVFGTPLDVTLSELAIESFFPADEETRFALQKMAAGQA